MNYLKKIHEMTPDFNNLNDNKICIPYDEPQQSINGVAWKICTQNIRMQEGTVATKNQKCLMNNRYARIATYFKHRVDVNSLGTRDTIWRQIVSIGPWNRMLPTLHQAITWTNADYTEHFRITFNGSRIKSNIIEMPKSVRK